MQNHVNKEIDNAMIDLARLSIIRKKLSQDENYQSAFKAELKNTEATELFNKGINLGDLSDFIKERINGILTPKHTDIIPHGKVAIVQKERADNTNIVEDVKTFRQSEQSIFSLVEKMDKQNFPEQIGNAFRSFVKSIPEEVKQSYQETINLQKFTFEPLAKDDFTAYEQKELSAYELYRKMTEKSDYKKSIEQIISESAPPIFIGSQKDNYIKSKLNEITEAATELSNEEKSQQKAAFDKKYPNGFKLSKEIETETINQSLDGYNEYLNLVNNFLDDEKTNDYERIKRTQDLMDFYLKNPDKIDALSEQYINDGTIKTQLPEPKFNAIQSLKTGKNFTTELKAKLLKRTQIIVKNAQSLGDSAKKSATQLQQYRMRQFKQEHSEVKKKLIAQQMSQNKSYQQKQSLRM